MNIEDYTNSFWFLRESKQNNIKYEICYVIFEESCIKMRNKSNTIVTNSDADYMIYGDDAFTIDLFYPNMDEIQKNMFVSPEKYDLTIVQNNDDYKDFMYFTTSKRLFGNIDMKGFKSTTIYKSIAI